MIGEEIFKTVIESLIDGIVVLNEKGEKIFTNKLGETLLLLGETENDNGPIKIQNNYFRLERKSFDTGQILLWRNVTELEEMRNFLIIDPETNAFSSKFMKEQLEREFDRIRRPGSQMALMLIDVDLGAEGPTLGDIVKAIRATLRIYDLVFRGDRSDFVIMLFAVEPDRIEVTPQRILQALKAINVARVSIGVCMSEKVPSAESMMKQAQRALYVVNNRGGNDYSIY